MKDRLRPFLLKKKRGFSLVSAIFILVIISLTGVYALKLSANVNSARILNNDYTRAYYMGKSGLEWALYLILNNGGVCPPTTTLSVNQGGLKNFQAVVSCTSSAFQEGSNNYSIFLITAVASRGNINDFDYVTSTLTQTLTTAP